MPDSGLMLLSVTSLVVGVALFLSPKVLLGLSEQLNRTLAVLDHQLIRHRHLAGLLAFGASYAFFKLALMVPHMRG